MDKPKKEKRGGARPGAGRKREVAPDGEPMTHMGGWKESAKRKQAWSKKARAEGMTLIGWIRRNCDRAAGLPD